MKTKLLVN